MFMNRPQPKQNPPVGGAMNTSRMSLQQPVSRSSQDSKNTNASSNWTGEYLKDLRTNRPARPTGARPLPSKDEAKSTRTSVQLLGRAASAMGMYEPASKNTQAIPDRSASAMSHRGPRELVGSPVARPPASKMRNVSGTSNGTKTTQQTTTSKTSNDSKASASQPYKIPYYERGQRWMEKQEMTSLRLALETKDLVEEQKVFDSAQDEAAKLVWKHQNPNAPYPYPEKVDLRSHLRKGSHAKTLSNTPFETLYVTKGGVAGDRSVSAGSNGSQRTVSDGSQGSNGSRSGRFSSLSFSVRSSRLFGVPGSKRNRVTSKGSHNGIFQNPNDKIFEEAKDITQTTQDVDKPLPLRVRPRNTSYGTKSIKDKISKIEEKSEHSTPAKNVSIVEIHKNSPSQSRNAHYRINKDLPPAPGGRSIESALAEQPGTRDGKEIRGEDIRAATTMNLKDRSPKLPMPTIVSDRPGRPIVSFQKDYKPRQKELQHAGPARGSTDLNSAQTQPISSTVKNPPIPSIELTETPTIQIGGVPLPSIVVPSDRPSMPTISLPDGDDPFMDSPSIPQISVGDASAPSISITPSVVNSASRPLPQPSKRSGAAARPLPSHNPSGASRSAPHWSPAAARGTAQCSACALPIAGKIVSASSKRFHPHCFTCFCCGELLECVAFYPEPEKFRTERLQRIQARLDGVAVPPEQAKFTEEEDGDDSLRFYCHLDFHERFSPRCKNCKTPIEGQAIVACGSEWHVGHFFCAECGDPFEADMPFVEKDGFAWCVNCHTKRYSGKCAGCRKPITDLVISALEREWHEKCFCCKECGGTFDDGRFFTRGEDEIPVCVRCEEKRLKA